MHFTHDQSPLQRDLFCLHSGPVAIIPLVSLIVLHKRWEERDDQLPAWNSEELHRLQGVAVNTEIAPQTPCQHFGRGKSKSPLILIVFSLVTYNR